MKQTRHSMCKINEQVYSKLRLKYLKGNTKYCIANLVGVVNQVLICGEEGEV